MSHFTLVASITANPDKIDLVKSGLTGLIEPTRAEKGCIQYDLHQDRENPAHFLFFEIWETRELWLDHTNSEHVQAHRAATEGALADFTLYELDKIG